MPQKPQPSFESGEGEQDTEEGGGDHEGKLSICDTAFLPLPLEAWGAFLQTVGHCSDVCFVMSHGHGAQLSSEKAEFLLLPFSDIA